MRRLLPVRVCRFFGVYPLASGAFTALAAAMPPETLQSMAESMDAEITETTPVPALRIVCAWCQPKTDEPGISHGICPECSEKELAKLAEHKSRKQSESLTTQSHP
jgi:hypothetical protein